MGGQIGVGGLDTSHGSLGLISADINHSSAGSRYYPYKAGSISLITKHSRPRILVHDGLNLLRGG